MWTSFSDLRMSSSLYWSETPYITRTNPQLFALSLEERLELLTAGVFEGRQDVFEQGQVFSESNYGFYFRVSSASSVLVMSTRLSIGWIGSIEK